MLVFVDVETTGLDERKGALLEVALVIVTDDLREVAAHSVVVMPLEGSPLDGETPEAWRRRGAARGWSAADPVVQEMHDKSGLWRAVEAHGVALGYAQTVLVVFLGDNVNRNREALGLGRAVDDPVGKVLSRTPLCGCNVGFDRRWLRQHVWNVDEAFSYRSVDVSSVTELARRWAPAVYEGKPRSTSAHRALPDARGAVELLRYYRWCGFVGGPVAQAKEGVA